MALIIIAQNITDPETHALVREDGTSLYDVEVSVNRERFIWCGKIDNHKRDDGAAKLLRLIADKMDEHEQRPQSKTRKAGRIQGPNPRSKR